MDKCIYAQFKKCTQVVFDGDVWDYECVKGLWGVTSADKTVAEEEALHYFKQYLEDGEYEDML